MKARRTSRRRRRPVNINSSSDSPWGLTHLFRDRTSNLGDSCEDLESPVRDEGLSSPNSSQVFPSVCPNTEDRVINRSASILTLDAIEPFLLETTWSEVAPSKPDHPNTKQDPQQDNTGDQIRKCGKSNISSNQNTHEEASLSNSPMTTIPTGRRRLSRGDILQCLDTQAFGMRHNVLDTGTSMYSSKPDLLSLLDEYFDITDDRLRTIFDSMDKDEDDIVSYEEFRESLRSMGIEGSDASFDRLVKTVDSDSSGGVTFKEFSRVLLDLFDSTSEKDVTKDMRGCSISFTLYNKQNIHFTNVTSSSEHTQPQWANVGWVHMRGLDSLMMERLAVKYRLHPLAVEDALNVEQRPKVEKYQGHLFIFLKYFSKIHGHSNRVGYITIEEEENTKYVS